MIIRKLMETLGKEKVERADGAMQVTIETADATRTMMWALFNKTLKWVK